VLEAEVAREPEAAGVEDVDLDAGPAQQLLIGVEPPDRVLVAVRLRDGRPSRARNQSVKRCRAKEGSSRRGSMPPARLITRAMGGVWTTAFSVLGAIEAIQTHSGSQPME
jgi:hypothetical protein